MKWWSIPFEYSPFTVDQQQCVTSVGHFCPWMIPRQVQSNLCSPTEEPEIARQSSIQSWKRKLSFAFAMGHASIIYIGVCIE